MRNVILGILSDTHGYQQRAAQAICLLEQLGATAFVHCGDIGGEAVLDELAGRQAWLVPGNVDALDPTLMDYGAALGLSVPEEIPLQIEIAGRRLAVYHGHEAGFERLIRAVRHHDRATFARLTRRLDYVLYGHLHKPADARVDRVRLINPGALERTRPYTVATLDLAHDALRFWRVDEQAAPAAAPRPFTPRP
jgi:putative phosphoesterase